MAKKKRRLQRALFRFILLLGVAALLIFGVVKLVGWLTKVVTGNTEQVTVFYYDDVIGTLVPVTHKVNASEGLPYAVINEVLKGPDPVDHAQPTVAKGTRLLSISEVKDKSITINLSKEAATPAPPCPEEYSLYSMVNSLCSLDGIESVKFLVDSSTPARYWKDFELNQEFRKQDITIPDTETLSAYFPERRNRYVAIEPVTIRKADTVREKARLVLQRFLQGPKSPQLRSPFASTTKVNGITFSGKLLTVNFSSAGLSVNTDAQGEQIVMQSLIWTLTDIKNVVEVKLTVDGQPVSNIGGHISCIDSFTRLDTRLIENPGDSIGSAAIIYLAADFGDGLYALVPRIRFLSGPAFDREPLDKLFAGPDATEKELGLVSCLPDDATLQKIVFGDGKIDIDLSSEASKSPNRASESTFIDQIIRTATEANENRNNLVNFTIAGESRENLSNGTVLVKRTRQP